jgi:hypothetical protein
MLWQRATIGAFLFLSTLMIGACVGGSGSTDLDALFGPRQVREVGFLQSEFDFGRANIRRDMTSTIVVLSNPSLNDYNVLRVARVTPEAGTGADQFRLNFGSCVNLLGVAPGARENPGQCRLILEFYPGTIGSYAASIEIDLEDRDSGEITTATLRVRGEGEYFCAL